MENVLKYYDFSNFFEDHSGVFNGNQIAYTVLNEQHFLIFVKNNDVYDLYVSKFLSKNEIGQAVPEILELLIENYDTSIPEHRVLLRQYLY